MWIEQMEIEHFGCLKDRTVRFAPGLNVVTGNNEAGKTTSLMFLKGMLYGLPRARGRAAGKEALRLYEPWTADGRYGGSIAFTCGGRRLTLYRDFLRPDRSRLFCPSDGEELSIEEGDMGVLLGEVPEALYVNTCMARQETLRVSENLPEALSSYLLNLESAQDEEINGQKAAAYLKKQYKELGEEIARLDRERLDACGKAEGHLAYLREETSKLEARKERFAQSLAQEEHAGRRKIEEDRTEGQGRTHVGKGRSRVWLFVLLTVAGGVTALAGLAAGQAAGLSAILPQTVSRGILVLGLAILAVGIVQMGWSIRRRDKRDRGDEKKVWRQENVQEEARRLTLDRMEEELEEKRSRIESLQEELEELYEDNELLREKKRQMRAVKRADEELDQAIRRLTARRGEQLFAKASEILEFLTEGAYGKVRWETGAQAGEITVSDGRRLLRPYQLSTAVREQIYMSVRLGAAMCLAEEPLPLLLDDPFANWDKRRYDRALQWLEECGRQVIFCTCREGGRNGSYVCLADKPVINLS